RMTDLGATRNVNARSRFARALLHAGLQAALLCACAPKVALRVPPEALAELPLERKLTLLDAENDLLAAVDSRDAQEELSSRPSAAARTPSSASATRSRTPRGPRTKDRPRWPRRRCARASRASRRPSARWMRSEPSCGRPTLR